MKDNTRALIAAVIGAAAGYFGFVWIVRQGFYALVLPGGLAGIGAGLFKPRSVAVCVACGVLALAAGLYAEWSVFPFRKDESLGYFLTHAYQLKPITLIMIAAGAAMGFWLPFSHRKDPPRS